jgi:internalin A
MKLAILVGVLFAASTAAFLGCDDAQKTAAPSAKAPLSAAPMGSSSASAVATFSAAPTASAAAAPVKRELAPCAAGADVKTDDAALDAELRRKLQKKPGQAIAVTELGRVASLNLTNVGKPISALDHCYLPKMSGVKSLFLGEGDYDDLSPIAGLVHLESLRASVSRVSNLKPLEKLTKLDRLDLGRTPVRDISILANLVELTELQLDGTEVQDLAPLAKCVKLQRLSLRNTTVQDVSPLAGLKSLKSLDLQGTAPDNVQVLAPLVARGLKVSR